MQIAWISKEFRAAYISQFFEFVLKFGKDTLLVTLKLPVAICQSPSGHLNVLTVYT